MYSLFNPASLLFKSLPVGLVLKYLPNHYVTSSFSLEIHINASQDHLTHQSRELKSNLQTHCLVNQWKFIHFATEKGEGIYKQD